MSRARGEGAGWWDRLARPSERGPGSGTERWHEITARFSDARVRLADGFLTRWNQLADRTHLTRMRLRERSLESWDRLRDRALDRWDRIALARTAFGERMADGWSRSIRVLRRPIVVFGIMVAALCIAAGIVLLQAWTGDAPVQRGARQPAPASSTGSDPSLGTNFQPPSAVPSAGTNFQPPSAVASPGTNFQPPSAGPSVSIPSDSGGASLPGLDVHVNEAAGYLFSYPSSWEIGRQGGIDRLRNPGGDVLMTFEVAPPGTLQSASDTVVARIARPYTDVELDTGPIEQTPQGLPSLVVGGRGIGPGGAAARFLVITIQGPDGNRAIAVHFSPDAQPLEALPVIREVIASYRISTAD